MINPSLNQRNPIFVKPLKDEVAEGQNLFGRQNITEILQFNFYILLILLVFSH